MITSSSSYYWSSNTYAENTGIAWSLSFYSGEMTDFRDITVTLNPVNDPPALPFNESPVDGSMDVALDTVFSWQCSDPEDDAITPHLYLSIENASADEISNGKMVLDTKEKTAENTVFTWRLTLPPGTLQYDTPYTWRVGATDSHGLKTQGRGAFSFSLLAA